jgi:methionyl-tRNA formyltransferase
VAHGVRVTGVTVHFVDEGVDTGPILLQRPIELTYTRPVHEVTEEIHAVEHELLPRAIELIADGEHARAVPLLARSTDATADHAAAVAACALAQGRHADAIEPLGRAIALEPTWPLHHWNLAVAQHALGDAAGTYHALRRFLATSARPTALHGDPDQASRIAYAELRIVELERAARLMGRSLRRRNRAKSKRRSL